MRFDKDWNAEPYLAESWSFQDDGRSVLLKLRAGATFHDGKPIGIPYVVVSGALAKVSINFTAYGSESDAVKLRWPSNGIAFFAGLKLSSVYIKVSILPMAVSRTTLVGNLSQHSRMRVAPSSTNTLSADLDRAMQSLKVAATNRVNAFALPSNQY